MNTFDEGGGAAISLDPAQLDHFAQRALAISTIFQNQIGAEINWLGRLGYYESGEAREAFAKYRQALGKFEDLGDFYYRAAHLLTLIADIMSRQDQALADSYHAGR